MTAIRANFGDCLAPGFRAIFFDKFNSYPDEYKEIVNVLTSDRQYEDDSSVSGFGLVPQKNESSGITYDDPIQGFNVRYTHVTYGLGFRVSREMWEDDLYSIMRKMPKALARRMRLTMETDVANLLNRAFSTSYLGGDGSALCVTTHALTGGGTEQNTLTTAADLSETTFEQALIDIAATVDDRNLVLALRPKKMVVPPSLDFTASKLLESTLVPESANNAMNPAKGRMPYVVNHYLTDTDAWFILCEDHELNMFMRRKPDFEQGNDFDTEDAKFKGTARWKAGWSEWRGIYGSAGA